MADESKGARTLTDAERETMAAEIPPPPADLADELDNAGGAGATPAAAPAPAAPARPVVEPDYVDGPEGTLVQLARPFRLDGRVVSEVMARPLSLAETGRIVGSAGTGADVFDFYEGMTGLPAAVIRGLRGRDGEAVSEACYPFLPRFMRVVGD